MLMNLCYNLLDNYRKIIYVLQLENGDRKTLWYVWGLSLDFSKSEFNLKAFSASDYICFGDLSLFKFCTLEHFSVGQIHVKMFLNLNKYLENHLNRGKLEFLLHVHRL